VPMAIPAELMADRAAAWAESDVAADIDRVHGAAPCSAEPAELRRSLRATAELYAWALDRWSQRTGRPAPRNPLARAITDKLRTG